MGLSRLLRDSGVFTVFASGPGVSDLTGTIERIFSPDAEALVIAVAGRALGQGGTRVVVA